VGLSAHFGTNLATCVAGSASFATVFTRAMKARRIFGLLGLSLSMTSSVARLGAERELGDSCRSSSVATVAPGRRAVTRRRPSLD
jgi:hypothetical protein